MSDAIDGVCVHGCSSFYLINMPKNQKKRKKISVKILEHNKKQAYWIYEKEKVFSRLMRVCIFGNPAY